MNKQAALDYIAQKIPGSIATIKYHPNDDKHTVRMHVALGEYEYAEILPIKHGQLPEHINLIIDAFELAFKRAKLKEPSP